MYPTHLWVWWTLKMRNVIIWHWFIKNLVGTWRRNDVDVTSLRHIDIVTTSCACKEFAAPLAPPPPNYLNLAPQYSKPSCAYGDSQQMKLYDYVK